jgi:hypothetical protein
MTATSIAPLRKRTLKGRPYNRPREIEAKLLEISTIPRSEIAARCAIRDPESTGFLPSECLLYLVREHRSKPMDECAEILFKTLMERVLNSLPQADSRDGASEGLTAGNVRDEGRNTFLVMLMKDRQEYFDTLDFYEVRFAKALKKLRLSAQRKVYPKENPLQSIECDPETGELSDEVERATGSFERIDWHASDKAESLRRLSQAIDALPDFEKAIIEMDQKEIPVESKEPGVVNIANILGKTPKTIRTRRKIAYATLRAALTKGE